MAGTSRGSRAGATTPRRRGDTALSRPRHFRARPGRSTSTPAAGRRSPPSPPSTAPSSRPRATDPTSRSPAPVAPAGAPPPTPPPPGAPLRPGGAALGGVESAPDNIDQATATPAD